MTPEIRELWVDVILQARHDCHMRVSRPHRGEDMYFKRDAIAWINREECEEPGSFGWVCELLKIDRLAIRAAIIKGCQG